MSWSQPQTLAQGRNFTVFTHFVWSICRSRVPNNNSIMAAAAGSRDDEDERYLKLFKLKKLLNMLDKSKA